MRLFPFLIFILLFIITCRRDGLGNVQEAKKLSGEWAIRIYFPETGILETRMKFVTRTSKEGASLFQGYSRRNADRALLGIWKSQLARWFTKKFKYGSILHVERGQVINGDSITGILSSPMGRWHMNGRIGDGIITCVLSNRTYQPVGRFEGEKKPLHFPLRNYPAIIQTMLAVSQERIYDRRLLNSLEWKKFRKNIIRVGEACQDDADFLLGFYYRKSSLPFSHFGVYRPKAFEDAGVPPMTNVTLEKKEGFVYMRIQSFSGTAAEIDSAFIDPTIIDAQNLVIDIRGNSGGSISAGMALISHLIPDTLYGGIFLTQKYFNAHTEPPHVSQYGDFLFLEESSYQILLKGISEQPGICLIGYPVAPTFKGKVYVLVDHKTASTCEPIIYGLRQHHLATIVGETTAGAMLNGERFPLGDGFQVIIPTAVYYTADGFKLDQKGVDPDLQVPGNKALDIVLALIAKAKVSPTKGQ